MCIKLRQRSAPLSPRDRKFRFENLYSAVPFPVYVREVSVLAAVSAVVIFGPKRDEATGGWRKLHNEELPDLYSSPSIIGIIKSRRMRWAGHVARLEERRNAYRLLVGKPEGKRPLGRPRRRWVDLLEIGWGGVDWICQPRVRNKWRALVNAVLNLRVP
jgi:hypothetical protein